MPEAGRATVFLLESMSTSKPPSGPAAATDKDVQALLLRLQCPTPLHVLRTLFLGSLASPRLDVSPMAPVAQAWGGEMPEFASTAEVEEVFGMLVQGLWNRLSEHQSSRHPFRLPRFEVADTRQALHDLARMRAQELKGFVDGLFGSEDEMLLPKKAHEAVVALSELHAMFDGAAALLADEPFPQQRDAVAGRLGGDGRRRRDCHQRGRGGVEPGSATDDQLALPRSLSGRKTNHRRPKRNHLHEHERDELGEAKVTSPATLVIGAVAALNVGVSAADAAYAVRSC